MSEGRQYTYRTACRWTGERRGTLASPGKPDLQVATPPEFRGHEDVWTPENMLVGALEACVMLTFLYYADRADIKLVEYSSEAEGQLDAGRAGMAFTSFKVQADALVGDQEDVPKAQRPMNRAADACLVTRSLAAEVDVQMRVRATGD